MGDCIDWYLIRKSFQEELTPREQEQLDQWLEASELHRHFYSNALSGGPTNPETGLDTRLLEQQKKVLLERIYAPEIRLRKRWLRWGSCAAVVALAIGITLISETKVQEIPPQKTVQVLQPLPALPPGSNKAVLTLSDGRRIVLDSMQNKVVADGNGEIRNEAHTLIYSGQTSVVPVYNTISIPRGGEYHVVLSDGTEVWGNSCTEIRYPVAFSASERVVYLNGEAYFEVKKESRPFKVIVRDLEVKVYGTSFNVNAYDEKRVETTLVDGLVGLSRQGEVQEVRLQPSEQAHYQAADSCFEVRPVNVYDFVAWKYGEFVFNDQTIEEIMERLSLWYDIEVKYADSQVRKRKFTGVMQRYATIDKILYYIQETATIRFSAQGKEITVK